MSHFIHRDRCPACRSSRTGKVYECGFADPPIVEYLTSFYTPKGGLELEYLNDETFILAACRDCRLVFQQEIPDDFLMARLYEKWIDPKKDFEEFRQNGNLPRFARYLAEIMVLIAYLGRPPRELRFLDFGMGWGRWCYLAQALDCEVYGAELSQARADYARARGIETIDWADIPARRFDFINSEQVFEHLPDPIGTLRQLVPALKPDGLIKLSVPNGKDVMRRLRIGDWTAAKGTKNSLNLVSPLEHINCYRRESLVKMARSAGLEPVQMPLRLQFAYSNNWRGAKQILRNLAWPVYKNILRRGTYLFFRRREGQNTGRRERSIA